MVAKNRREVQRRDTNVDNYSNEQINQLYTELMDKVLARFEEIIDETTGPLDALDSGPEYDRLHALYHFLLETNDEIIDNYQDNDCNSDFGFLWETIDKSKRFLRRNRITLWLTPVDEYRDIPFDTIQWNLLPPERPEETEEAEETNEEN